jgi:hypothetical protein
MFKSRDGSIMLAAINMSDWRDRLANYAKQHAGVRCFWTFGFSSSDLLEFISTVPLDMICSFMTVVELSTNLVSEVSFRSLCQPEVMSQEVLNSLILERNMWEAQNECGFLQMAYDPDTGERVGVALNDLQAQFLGMHREELLARLAAHDAPLFAPPQDILLLLADAAMRGFDDGTRYFRVVAPRGRLQTPVLVCVSTRSRYNHAGQLLTVRARIASAGSIFCARARACVGARRGPAGRRACALGRKGSGHGSSLEMGGQRESGLGGEERG